MSVSKKQKIRHDKQNDTVLEQLAQLEQSLNQHFTTEYQHLEIKKALKRAKMSLFAAMEVLNNDRWHDWNELPLDIRQDPDCVIQALRQDVPMRLEDIPAELLKDRQVALEAAKAGIYEDFEPTSEEWCHSKKLGALAMKQKIQHDRQNDSVSQKIAQLGQSVNQYFATEYQDLMETKKALKRAKTSLFAAMEVLNKDGWYEWNELPLDIRQDPDCVIQALRQDVPMRLEEIPTELLQDRQVALEAAKAGIYEDFVPKPEEWRHSKKLSALAMMQGSVLSMNQVPELAHQDVVELVKSKKLPWSRIPDALKENESFCRCIVAVAARSASASQCRLLAAQVFQYWPHFRQDRQIWEEIVALPQSDLSGLEGLLRNEAPPELLSDAVFMQQAYEKNHLTLQTADATQLEQFIQNKIRETPKHLAYCPPTFPSRSPEFVKSQLVAFSNSLSAADYGILNCFVAKIPTDLRASGDFVTAWFREAGLPMTFIHWFRANRGMILLLVEHCRYLIWKLSSLLMAPDHLLDDVSFISEAMRHEPILFEVASARIRNSNFELAMAALSQPLFTERYADAVLNGHTPSLSEEALDAFRSQAVRRLLDYYNFAELFLGGLFCLHGDPLRKKNVRSRWLSGNQDAPWGICRIPSQSSSPRQYEGSCPQYRPSS